MGHGNAYLIPWIGGFGAFGLLAAWGQAAPPGPERAILQASIERETAAAEKQGYVAHYTAHLVRQAEGLPEEEARTTLLRAKGALLNLKLPRWARELRYYSPADPTLDPDRGVLFWNDWALPGDFPGQWFRGHCRPSRQAAAQLAAFHQQGKRVGTYMSGGMVPITYALLSPSLEEASTVFMRKYAGAYWWHGERWWGATGDHPAWREWMLPHLDFAAQLGFDFVHLDEAWGAYPEARPMNERNPSFVVVPNNFAMTYVDQEGFRFGWTAMGEAVGHPKDWDNFHRNMRERSLQADNLTTWGYLYYEFPDAPLYSDLCFATTLANRITDVSLTTPSRPYVAFSRRFSDYLFGSYVDLYVPQERVRLVAGGPSVRTALNQRTLLSGKRELILHLFNIDPHLAFSGQVQVEVEAAGLPLVDLPVVTFASPEAPPERLAARQEGGTIAFTLPGVKVWGIAVIGLDLFPQATLRLASRGGAPVDSPLDHSFVPGEAFEVDLALEPLAPEGPPAEVELHLPAGWTARELDRPAGGHRRFRVLPAPDCERDHGYAITPILHQAGEAMPSWPLQLQAKEALEFRLLPPCIDAPAREASPFELEVKNNAAPASARITLMPPAGWQIDAKPFEVDLAAGETKRLPFSLQAPDLGVRLWSYADDWLNLQWQLGTVEGTSPLRLRVFPALFSVYHAGVEKLIMHGYPNVYFRGNDFEAARKRLEAGEYVALWLVQQDPEQYAPLVDWFLAHGGGVVWMGSPLPGENGLAELEAENARAGALALLDPGNAWSRLTAPVLPFKSYFQSGKGFPAFKVKARPGSQVLATWGPDVPPSAAHLQGSPAAIVSTDPARRLAYLSSDLGVASEEDYRFEDRFHVWNHWYLTYFYYNLLAWAAGAAR